MGMNGNLLKENWQKAFENVTFRIYFPAIVIAFIIIIILYGKFLDYIELRQGSILEDPVLNLFIPIEVTWITFGIIYISVIMVLIHLSWQPMRLLTAFQAYIFIAMARMISMYLTPLDPPPHLIPLEDPFVQSISSSGVLTRDLFFSGHTSTLFLLFLSCTGRKMKIFFLICTLLVGSLVLVQHVHYSIDVVAAPFYAYTCFKISSYLISKVLG